MSIGAWLLAQSDLARLLAQTGWVARIVLLILLGFSVISWAVIFQKSSRLRRARSASQRFLDTFRAAKKLPDPDVLTSTFAGSPLVAVYAAGMRELEAQVEANPHGGKLRNADAIEVALHAGLFAAIPAVIAYNHFLHQIRDFATRMDNFALEFLVRAEKQYS
jgi:biopolymer transport protein ExbB/TolQ